MPYEFECTFKTETDLAVKVVHIESDTEHWIPRKLIEDMHQPEGIDKPGSITIPSWFARKLGLK